MIKKQRIPRLLFAAWLLLASSALFAQVKVGTNPTLIETNSNLEVEAATTGRKVKVDKTSGQLTIKDGTEGTYKVLTSDANGAASWQTLRSTAISSSPQASPGVTLNFPVISGSCIIGPGAPPACATDINQSGTFSIVNPANDVIIDLSQLYTIANNTTQVYFYLAVYVDLTTPGVFEYVGNNYVTHTAIGCGSNTLLSKIALKNLPVRSNYTAKVYFAPWVNSGAAAKIGIGAVAVPGCGAATFASNKLILSVSQ